MTPQHCAPLLAAALLAGACAARGAASTEAALTYREVRIEQPPMPTEESFRPQYPAELIPTGYSGRVVARFDVTEEGLVDSATFTVVSSTHPLFTSAVLAAVPRLRFRPAELARQECAFAGARPVLRNGRPLCRGRPVRTGERVRTNVYLPFDFSPP